MALPSPVPRYVASFSSRSILNISRNQKVIKPQFFDCIRQERENYGLLDQAAAYLSKKAAIASVKMSERPLTEDGSGAWGGFATKTTLATEIVPMLVKMQGLSSGE
jgi:hypothetical protein